RLLCLGDVMLDRFVHGRVDRISPEAPIPILSMEGEWETPGGAANVARNAAALGARIDLFGIVGDDQEGERFPRLAEQDGVSANLLVQPGRRTTMKIRYLAGGHQLLRADRDNREGIDIPLAARLSASVEALLDEIDAVVLSDYGQGVLSGDLPQRIIACAKA